MLAPSMALSVYFFAFMTLVVGMGMGWAWGCAAMAAGLRARSQVLLASAIQRETATYVPSYSYSVLRANERDVIGD